MNQHEIMQEQLAAMDDLSTELGDYERLRDAFALAAMQAIISASGHGGHVDYDADHVARNAYEMANAMMQERGE